MIFEKAYVPKRGLEPPHPKAPEPKSGVSTNFTTWADLLERFMSL